MLRSSNGISAERNFSESIEICVDNDRAGTYFGIRYTDWEQSIHLQEKKVYFERGILMIGKYRENTKLIYEEVAKEMNVAPEAIMAIHKIENNLTENNQIVSFGEIHGVFAKSLR